MNCVTADCPNEAKKGENHCMSHEKKHELVLKPTYAAILLAMVVKILKEWSSTPPISQRTLITAVQQLQWAQFGLSREPFYDEVALVLRQAVDSGYLVSHEKNDTTFYELPPAAPAEPERRVPRNVEIRDNTVSDARGNAIGILSNMPTHLGFQKLEAIEPPGPTITESTLRALGLNYNVCDAIRQMLMTGLYGDGYDQFVREAICAHVREYVKGKK